MERTGLATVLLMTVLVTGCTGTGPSSGTTDHSPTTQCSSLTTSSGLNSDVRHDHPEKPYVINRSSVRKYVEAFERTYAWNRKYASAQTEFHVDVNGINVEPRDDGYIVRVGEIRTSQSFGDNSVGDDAWSAHYFINESVVLRREGHAGGPTSIESEWVSIQC